MDIKPIPTLSEEVNDIRTRTANIVAEKEGFLMDYVQKITRSMWEREKKMDDPEVIKAEYDHWGFDSSLLMDGMNDPEIKSSLMDKTSEAV